MGVNGVTWGLAPLLFFPEADTVLMAFISLVTLGIYSGGLAWMAPVKAAVMSYSLPIMVMLTLALLMQDEYIFKLASVMTLVYLMNSWKFVLQHHQLLTDSLMDRYEKVALADKLARQVALVEKASEEKTRFLAAASHDLRQPLHAIALFSAVLERALAQSHHQDTATRMANSVRLLGSSLDAMLDISRLDAGTIEVNRRPVALQRLFEALNSLFSAQAGEKGLELRVRPSPLWVDTDVDLLQRMLTNLVANALKYTHEGGVLVVARQRQGAVWIEVRDTGLGMARDEIGRIFDEFYQINNPGRDRSMGLGIGLSIVNRISHLLNHPIEVQSSQGKGSTFRLRLPLAHPVLRAPVDNTTPAPTLDTALPRRVLMLDDEKDIQHAISTLLRQHGIDATCVSTPEQARSTLKEQDAGAPHEVLLCDVRLANGEDGLAFASSLVVQMPRPPAVILITGETATNKLQRLRESGFEVLFKPVSAQLLLGALSRNGHSSQR
jgi:signal transduction histidine kinase/ActR/RegA family two-component response regulator